MLKTAIQRGGWRTLALVTALALLGTILAGCGQHGPTLPSPDGRRPQPQAAGQTTFLLRTDPNDPNTTIRGAKKGEFTIYEAADKNAQPSSRPITCFEDRTTGPSKGNADVVIALDRSGSMSASVDPTDPASPNRLEASKDAAKLMVGMMSANDRAEVIAFDSTVSVLQTFTSDQTALNNAIDGISLGGSTAAWDAAKQGLDDLVANGRKSVALAVILLTDGADNSSSTSKAGLIAAAKAANIPIYTIGLGSGINVTDLQDVANQTGGQFIQTTDQQTLQNAFKTIFKKVTAGGDYKICWASAFAPGTKVWVRIVYKQGTADELVPFEGFVTVKKVTP